MGLNDKQKEELKAEAKQILDNFAKTLAGIKVGINSKKTNSEGYREKSSLKIDSGFRKKMFANAPKTNDNYIIAEKKQW